MATFPRARKHLEHEDMRILHEGDPIVGYHSTSPYRRRADHYKWNTDTSQRRRTWFGSYDQDAIQDSKSSTIDGVDEDVAIKRRTEEMFMRKYKGRVAQVSTANAEMAARKDRAKRDAEARAAQAAREKEILAEQLRKEKAVEREREEARKRALKEEERELEEARRRQKEERDRLARELAQREADEEKALLMRARIDALKPKQLNDSFFDFDRMTRYVATRWSRNVSTDGSRLPRPLDEERIMNAGPNAIAFPNAATVFRKSDWEIVDGNEFEVLASQNTVIRFSKLPNKNLLLVFEPDASKKSSRNAGSSWVEYAKAVASSTCLEDAFFACPWVAKRWGNVDQDEDKFDPSAHGRHELIGIDFEAVSFLNSTESYPRSEWRVNDSRSFFANSEGPTLILLRRGEDRVLKVLFKTSDEVAESGSAPWIEYVPGTEFLRKRTEEDARREKQAKAEAAAKARAEEEESRRRMIADARFRQLERERDEMTALAASKALPGSPEKRLDEEDDIDEEDNYESSKGFFSIVSSETVAETTKDDEIEADTADEERAYSHMRLSVIQSSESKVPAPLPLKSRRLTEIADRMGEADGVGMIMTPGGTVIRHGAVVSVRGKRGFVQYVGYTNFKAGLWVGIEMNHVGDGKHDGSIRGVQYFVTNPGRGLFVRPWNVKIVGKHDTHGKSMLTPAWKLFVDPETGHRYYYNRDPVESVAPGFVHAKHPAKGESPLARISSKRVARIVRRASFKARQALRQLSPSDTLKLFEKADPKGTGMLDKDEFIAACKVVNPEILDDEADALFDYLDVNRDDAINFYEFVNFVHHSTDPLHEIEREETETGGFILKNSTLY